MTTRIPRTFSSMDSFSRSYLRKMRRKVGSAFLPMSSRPQPKTGITTTKVSASFPPMIKAMVVEKISSRGARTATRMSII